MPVLTVGGEKGGCGKITIAVNLAAIHADAGHEVLLVNGDPQDTAGKWAGIRAELHPDAAQITAVSLHGPKIGADIKKLSEKYETVIVDAGGRDSVEFRAALVVTDGFVMPLQASSADTWTFEEVDEILAKVEAFNADLVGNVVTTRVHHSLKDKAKELMAEELKDWPRFNLLDTFVVNRQAYQSSFAEGLAVTETSRVDGKARTEMMNLYAEVF